MNKTIQKPILIILNTLKSRTSQNVAGGGILAALIISFLSIYVPDLVEDDTVKLGIIAVCNSITTAFLSRSIAFIRSPEKLNSKTQVDGDTDITSSLK